MILPVDEALLSEFDQTPVASGRGFGWDLRHWAANPVVQVINRDEADVAFSSASPKDAGTRSINDDQATDANIRFHAICRT